MKKKQQQSVFTIACAATLIIAFMVISMASQSGSKKENPNQQLIESCKLQRVELVSFNPEAEIIIVNKHFGNDYLEKSKYYLPYLPTIAAADSRTRKMASIVTASNKTIAFDQAGNAYCLIGNDVNADKCVKIGM